MAWNDGLLGVHLEIAADPSPVLHVLAGPGTGKTYAMMRRIARLLESGTSPDRILAVTFTRTAARDLKEQLTHLGIEAAEQVRASTLHSLCYSILHQEAVFHATGRVARPLLSYEQDQLVNDLARQFGQKRRVRALLKAHEAGWASLQQDLVASGADEESEAALIDWLRYHRCVLIGELVPLTLNYIRQNPALEVLSEFDHVLVDEYQDLNRADQALVEELARHGTITVVGDDNQSIYRFRYANPEAIRTFPNQYPETASYVIDECRRSPPNIVAMSNALISNNAIRTRDLPLRVAADRPPADVYIVQHRSVDIEIETIADFVHQHLDRHPNLPPGQVLVLSPRRFIGQGIRRELVSRGRNALSYFFEDELERYAAADGFCLLNLLVNPTDRAGLRAWIGLGQSQNGFAPGYARIRAFAQDNGLELHEVLNQLGAGELTIPYTAGIVGRCQVLQERLTEVSDLTGLDLVRSLWSPEDPDSLDIRILAENLAGENPEPAALLGALLREITQPQLPDSESDIIRVMSLHKAKGLTADVVVVAGCVSGALPTINRADPPAVQDAQLQEQRRLFYVAITRPSETLVISSAVSMPSRDALANGIDVLRHRRIGGTRIAITSASPFIDELGTDAPRTMTTQQWRELCQF